MDKQALCNRFVSFLTSLNVEVQTPTTYDHDHSVIKSWSSLWTVYFFYKRITRGVPDFVWGGTTISAIVGMFPRPFLKRLWSFPAIRSAPAFLRPMDPSTFTLSVPLEGNWDRRPVSLPVSFTTGPEKALSWEVPFIRQNLEVICTIVSIIDFQTLSK